MHICHRLPPVRVCAQADKEAFKQPRCPSIFLGAVRLPNRFYSLETGGGATSMTSGFQLTSDGSLSCARKGQRP